MRSKNSIESLFRMGLLTPCLMVVGVLCGASHHAEALPSGPIGTSILRKPSEGLNQLSAAASWAGRLLDDPIQTFAGRHANDLNRFLAEGEDALKRSEYYTAARYFEMNMRRSAPGSELTYAAALLISADLRR